VGIICKRLPGALAPMSLRADHANVQVNFYRQGLGVVAAEMHRASLLACKNKILKTASSQVCRTPKSLISKPPNVVSMGKCGQSGPKQVVFQILASFYTTSD
jgi:hypothetical protein